MDEDRKLGFATRAIHGARTPPVEQETPSVPIYQTATFRFEDSEAYAETISFRRPGYTYTRGYGNPTLLAFETVMADLEGNVLAYSLGELVGTQIDPERSNPFAAFLIERLDQQRFDWQAHLGDIPAAIESLMKDRIRTAQVQIPLRLAEETQHDDRRGGVKVRREGGSAILAQRLQPTKLNRGAKTN